MHRVVVTGLGCVSPYGVGIAALWQGLLSGQSALRYDSVLGTVVGRVPDYFSNLHHHSDEKTRSRPLTAIIEEDLVADLKRRRSELSRASEFALIAACEAHRDAGLDLRRDGAFHADVGVSIGSGISDLSEIFETGKKIEDGDRRRVSPFFVPKILTNTPAGCIAQRFHLGGGNLSSSVACATGANCIGDAFNYIRAGRWKAAFAGGTESCINEIAIAGFSRMKALARGESGDISCPFDRKRSGFVLSEGAAVLFMERLDDALKRGAQIYAEILGYGISSDAFHVSAPEPSGAGSKLCMQRCMEDARLTTAATVQAPDTTNSMTAKLYPGVELPTYVNAHATSTPLGDAAEAHSILSTPMLSAACVSSLKGHIGHAQAAAGALETAATVLSVRNALVPPTLNFEKSDEKCQKLDIVAGETRAWQSRTDYPSRRIALKNSFGFGGAFVSLAVAEYTS